MNLTVSFLGLSGVLKQNWIEKLENEANSWKDLFLFLERNNGSDYLCIVKS